MVALLTTTVDSLKITDNDFLQLRDFIYDQTGIYVAENRKYLLENRLANRLKALGLKTFGEYYYYLRFDAGKREELKRLFEVITTKLDGHVEGLVPPPALLRRHGVAQELVGAGAVGGRRRGRGQQDEGVLVALLAGLRVDGNAVALGVQLVAHRRVPAAVLVVPHRPTQGPHAVVGEAAAAGNAHEGAQRKGDIIARAQVYGTFIIHIIPCSATIDESYRIQIVVQHIVFGNGVIIENSLGGIHSPCNLV